MDVLRHSSSACGCGHLIASYERLAALYHDLLGQKTLAELLERAADSVAELVPCTSLLIAETDRATETIVPLVARGLWPEETLRMRPRFGEGLIGWAVANGRSVLCNEAHLDPRASHVAGTPDDDEPEAIMCLPLIARGVVIGALSVYREGAGATFSEEDFGLGQRFADAVTLALEHATSRHQLELLARTDDLTGCLNRRGLHEEISRLVGEAGADDSIALLLVDLNEFKSVNDRFGHSTGDFVLCRVADALLASAPEEAVVARLGGDEFAVALRASDGRRLDAVVESLDRAVNPLNAVARGGGVSVSATIGAAQVPASTPNLAERLLTLADQAMYGRKSRTAASR